MRTSDPFTRRQTRPTIVTKDVIKSGEEKRRAQEELKEKIEKENRKKEEDANKLKLEKERAKESERKRIQEEDLYAAHDFDLNIDFGPAMNSEYWTKFFGFRSMYLDYTLWDTLHYDYATFQSCPSLIY